MRTPLIHPFTGQPIRPVGYRRDGRPIWPVMGGSEDAGAGQPAGDPGQQPAGDPQGQPPAGGQPAGQLASDKPDGKDDDDLSKLDQAALAKMVRDLRAENGKARTDAKKAAADDARQQLVNELGKALGLVKGDDKPDPDKLVSDLAASQKAGQDAQREAAALRAAAKLGARGDRLTDSRAFLARIAELDPAKPDAFEQAVRDAVKADPSLAITTAGRSGGDFGGSPDGATKKAGSLEEAVSARYAG